jgi:hypothetical protein
VYSFGMILYELFTEANPAECVPAAIREDPQKVAQWLDDTSGRPAFHGDGDGALVQEICERCWNSDVQARPSMEEVVDAIVEAARENSDRFDEAKEEWDERVARSLDGACAGEPLHGTPEALAKCVALRIPAACEVASALEALEL